MYMKMRGIIYIVILILLSSCGNFLDEYSQDLVVPKTVSDLNEVLLGNGYIPSSEIEYLRNGSIGWQLNILDDDINTVIAYNAVKNRTEMDGVYYGYTTWQMEVGRNHTGDNLSGDNGNWDALYQRINSMNIILHELGNVSQNTEQEVKDAIRVQGECYFLRAQFYLMLVNLYAKAYDPDNAATEPGVPLKLTYYVEHDKEKETQFDRTSVAKVYEQIVKDLKEAVRCFTESPQTKSFYRASEDAALLLLSRVYLYMQEWDLAIGQAQEVIKSNSTLFDLRAAGENSVIYTEAPITEWSEETIPGIGYLSEKNSNVLFVNGINELYMIFGGNTAQSVFYPSETLYNTYEKGDVRKYYFMRRNSKGRVRYMKNRYYAETYLNFVPQITSDYGYSRVIRTEEMYLILAEAYAHKPDGLSAAVEYLNTLREVKFRAEDFETYGRLHAENFTQQSLLETIWNERRREFCFEEHRWFDLRRTTRPSIVHSGLNGSATLQKDDPRYVLQIPQKELNVNPEIGANPR